MFYEVKPLENKGMWEYSFNELILLDNKYYRCYYKKMAVFPNSDVSSELSFECVFIMLIFTRSRS